MSDIITNMLISSAIYHEKIRLRRQCSSNRNPSVGLYECSLIIS